MYLLAVAITLISAANGVPIEIGNDAFGMVPPRSPSRIIFGRNASIEEFPYIVELEYKGSHTCGGSIISAEFVLTAAHCVSSVTAPATTIRAGTDTKNQGGSVHEIEKIYFYSERESTSDFGLSQNDLALVKVNPPFELDESRKPVELYEAGEKSVAGRRAVVIGWGKNDKGILSDVLQATELPIIDAKICHEAYLQEWGGLLPGQICAGLVQQSACHGDSGGPLTIDGRQAGLVSGGMECGSLKYPNVYTEIAYFRDWIRRVSGV